MLGWGPAPCFFLLPSVFRSVLYPLCAHRCPGWVWGVRSLYLDPFLFLCSSHFSFLALTRADPAVAGVGSRIIFGYLFMKHHPFPTPRGRHTSCHEMSYSRRETKLKEEKKNKFSPLCPLSCRLGHRRTSTLQGLHVAVAFRQGQGFIPRATPHAFPLKPPPFTPIPDHSLCLPDIQTTFP